MKLLVVGAGSMGRRHARNAAAITDAGIFDVDPRRCHEVAEQTGAHPFESLSDAVAWAPAAAVVATPPADHIPVASQLINGGADVLVEKPIAHRLEGLAGFVEQAEKGGRQVFVACNMRFHPGPATIQSNLHKIGRPLFARAYFGNFLPNMRPGVDYRGLYCAQAQQGGGVCLDGVHEIDYLTWMFGTVAECIGRVAKLSDFDTDVEDYAALLLRHHGGTHSEIHLDYLQQFKRRGCEIVGKDGTMVWESEGKVPERCTVRLHCKQNKQPELLFQTDSVDIEAPYREMLAEFASSVSGRKVGRLLDGRTAVEELAIVLQARVSWQTGKANWASHSA